jgi:hypothetical protein
VVSFTPRPLYPRRKNPRYQLDGKLGGTQSRSGLCGEEKNLLPLVGIKQRRCILTCRLLGKRVSVEMVSWKLTPYGTTFPWIRVVNKRFIGYEIEGVFSVGPSRCYKAETSRSPDQNGERSDQIRNELKIYCELL